MLFNLDGIRWNSNVITYIQAAGSEEDPWTITFFFDPDATASEAPKVFTFDTQDERDTVLGQIDRLMDTFVITTPDP